MNYARQEVSPDEIKQPIYPVAPAYEMPQKKAVPHVEFLPSQAMMARDQRVFSAALEQPSVPTDTVVM